MIRKYYQFIIWVSLWVLSMCVLTYIVIPSYQSYTFIHSLDQNSASSGSMTLESTAKALEEVYGMIQAQYYDTWSIDQTVMSRQAIASFVNALWDPFSSYLEPVENKDFTDALEWTQTIEWIGAYLTKKDAGVIVEQVVKSSPAAQVGIKPLDIIIKVNGSGIQSLSLSDVVEKIRGPRGTTVDLTLVRSGSWATQFIEKTVTRDTITIPSVSSKILTWKQWQHIGYISLSIFGAETDKLLQQEIQTLQKIWMSWLILDLRGNGWWLLPEAVTVASHFLSIGTPVVQAKYRIYTSQTYLSEWTNDLDLPLVILVDGGTASASEIVALALRESTCWWWSWSVLRDCIDPFPCPELKEWRNACLTSSRVLIIWQQTFGKWSIQVLQPVTFGGSLKLTVGKWFSPSGKTIDKVWITPDIIVDMDPERYLKDGIDAQLQKGLDILSQKRL